MLPVRTILHATDFSEDSRYAFRIACAIARDYGARLIVIHVMTPSVTVYGEGMIPLPSESAEKEVNERLCDLIAQHPDVQTETRLVKGEDAAAEILCAARECKCNLIAIGTHGRTGLHRIMMGSVAEQIVRRAPCPVLTIKLPEREEMVPAGAAAKK